MKVIFYSTKITPRIEYAANIVLQHILESEVYFTTNIEDFKNAEAIKINYSNINISGCINILPSPLLFENSISNFEPLVGNWKDLPVIFFSTQNQEFPFDPFAAAFWMATRYEEYLPFKPDKHGRFASSNSLASRNGFLSEPVVHLWADSLRQALIKQFPQFETGKRKFSYLSTIDVDSAWKYRHKGVIRTAAGFARDIVYRRTREISMRLKTLRGLSKDPFESYDNYGEINQEVGIVPQWFFLLANYGKYDINIDPRNASFQNLIRKLANTSVIGLHPSYNSGNSIVILEAEKKRLELILGTSVIKSRQHFLKLTFPETYRRLIKIGIYEDFSLGYHDQPGFRGGMCIPYPWFDLESNRQEDLMIIPFQIMDRTFTEYLHLKPNDAFILIRKIIDTVSKVNGQFVSIWHNEPADINDKEEWFEVYKKMQHYIHDLK
jgi:hypothetical protein